MNRSPLAFRILFSPGTAAAFVVLAAAALALSQMRVVADWLSLMHPRWPWPAWWLAAAGVELAILATGLVLANTGRRSLWAWEAGLVAASLLIGVDVSCRCLPSWLRALVGGAMAVQYLAVITAGHHLASHHPAAVADSTAAEVPTVAVQVNNTLVSSQPRRLSKRERLAELSALADSEPDVAELAEAWGVTESTVYRDLQTVRGGSGG